MTDSARQWSVAKRPWRISTQTAVIGQVAFLLILIAALSAVLVWREYDGALSRAEIRAANAAQTASEHARWILEASSQGLRRIDDLLRDHPEALAAGGIANLRDAIAALPEETLLSVYNAQGHSIMSTDPGQAQASIAEEGYFQAVRDGRGWYISPLQQDRATQRKVFTVSRRVEQDGLFMGVAVVVVPVELLSRFWASLDLGPGSSVALVRDDGWLVARYPVPQSTIDVSGHPLFSKHLSNAHRGSYRGTSPIDGRETMVGYHRVPIMPLVAVATVSLDAALHRLWQRLLALTVLGLPLVLALIAVSAWIVVLLRRDQTNRDDLARALRQNQMLLREVHHRVKNNLQVVASLVRLQPGPPEIKTEMSRRIAAMSAVHEQLYLSDQLGHIDIGDYIRKLVNNLAETYGRDAVINYELARIDAEVELAIPLGLIVSEITSNAFKHAFPDGRQPMITVELQRRDEGHALLRIADNGIGFDPEHHDGGLGLRLLKAFSQQLNATYSFHCDGGTTLELEFPLERPAESAVREMAAAA